MLGERTIIQISHTDERSKTGQIYARLKTSLVSQRVPPHAKLDIGVLADHLRVSKTPVREALILLAGEGIIFSTPGSGYFSKPLNPVDLADDYDLALTILKHVIDTSVIAFNATGLPSLNHEATENTATKPDLVHTYTNFIEALYERVASTATNRKYRDVIQAFNGRTTFIRSLDLMRPERLSKIAGDMNEFLELLGRRDAKGAVANLEMQYQLKLDLLHDLVAEAHREALRASQDWTRFL